MCNVHVFTVIHLSFYSFVHSYIQYNWCVLRASAPDNEKMCKSFFLMIRCSRKSPNEDKLLQFARSLPQFHATLLTNEADSDMIITPTPAQGFSNTVCCTGEKGAEQMRDGCEK